MNEPKSLDGASAFDFHDSERMWILLLPTIAYQTNLKNYRKLCDWREDLSVEDRCKEFEACTGLTLSFEENGYVYGFMMSGVKYFIVINKMGNSIWVNGDSQEILILGGIGWLLGCMGRL